MCLVNVIMMGNVVERAPYAKVKLRSYWLHLKRKRKKGKKFKLTRKPLNSLSKFLVLMMSSAVTIINKRFYVAFLKVVLTNNL